ncbi:MAG TPA: ADP-glyceromanno-heptose 6-epimerase [Gemmatimonadaceae bacterium]|nr:ADP-glyceromanno-heptose 6-epimerase [Gemmatimonadaceae bacterium]
MHPVLVSGAAGFIGYRFVERCRKEGIPVVSVDAREHFAARLEHRDVETGPIVDRHGLFDWLSASPRQLSGIVHLGACTDTTETDEALFARDNVEYSKRLWTYATEHRLPFVYASSAATYGDGTLGYDDDESLIKSLAPLNAYGRSKQAFDLWVLQQKTAPPAWSGWKFFNVYGYGERHKGHMASVVLHAFDQRHSGDAIRLFRSHRPGIADGQQARDFIDVGDVVSVLMFALRKPVTRGIRNLGTGTARTYLDLARAVCQALGLSEKIEYVDTPIEIRDKYQYFTQARMERLRQEGYREPFTILERGVAGYVKTLLDEPVRDRLSV